MGKYINTPGTLIYDKSRVLYGLSKAKLDIKRADQCVLVEGNMDALMSYQAGVRNVVASSGTALTPHHLRLLQRYTKNLGFCFDSDQAGALATRRGIGLALAQQFNIKVISIKDPACKDPADFVKRYGPVWSDVVASAKPVVDYYFDVARASYNPSSVESKKKLVAAVAPFVKRLSSNVEKAHWVGQLASLLGTPEVAVTADIASLKDDLDAYTNSEDEKAGDYKVKTNPQIVKEIEHPDIINEAILSIVIHKPSIFSAELANCPYEILNDQTASILRALVNVSEPFDFKTFATQFDGPQAMELEFANLRSQELWQDFKDEELKDYYYSLLNTLRRRAIHARLTTLQFDVKEAEQSKDQSRLVYLMEEFNKLANQLTLTHAHQKETQEKKPSDQETV